MSDRETPLYWSIPFGTWFYTRVRISIFFPLIVLVLCFRIGLEVGAVLSGFLLASVLVHEFGHVAAVRLTGGFGDQILIWPLGGLAFVQPAGTFRSRFLTSAAGPLTNLMVCVLTLWPVLDSKHTSAALNPLVLPFDQFSNQFSPELVSELFVLVFTVNWLLFLVNLIPVFPLDGGRMLQASLSLRLDGETATGIYIKIGFFVAIIAMLAGLMADNTFVLALGAVVLVLNLQESYQLRATDGYDESFMGYDFSQGYTSLERSNEGPVEPRPGVFERWKQKRRAEKRRRAEQKDAEVAQQLDAILDKVHAQGLESLTEAEKRLLHRASARFRDKGKRSH